MGGTAMTRNQHSVVVWDLFIRIVAVLAIFTSCSPEYYIFHTLIINNPSIPFRD